MPTSPRPIAATSRWKPARAGCSAPDRPRSSSITCDLRRRPAHLPRPFGELVLPTRALLVHQDLPRRRLADVDDGLQPQVTRLDLGRDGVHGTAPLAVRRPRAAGSWRCSRSAQSRTRCRCVSGRKVLHSARAGAVVSGLGALPASGAGMARPVRWRPRPTSARRLPGVKGQRRSRCGRHHAGRLRAACRQELPAPAGPLDQQVGFARVPLAPHHRDQLAEQRVVRRRDPAHVRPGGDTTAQFDGWMLNTSNSSSAPLGDSGT